MQSNSASTLELVVNDQQLQNMSQIDLSRASDSQPRPLDNQLQQDATTSQQNGFGLSDLKEWPARFRDNLNAKLDEAKAGSDTRTQYFMELAQAFSGIIIWLLCFVFTIILPVILFFVGLFNLDSCQALPSLPYLVFSIGFVMTASNLFNLALALDLKILNNHSQLGQDVKNMIASILNILFNCLVAFLYILTAYKILITLEANHEAQGTTPANGTEDSISYNCNPTLVNLTYYFITITLGSIITLGVLGAILFAYTRYRLAIIRGSTPRSQNQQHPTGGLTLSQQPNTNPYPVTSTNRV